MVRSLLEKEKGDANTEVEKIFYEVTDLGFH